MINSHLNDMELLLRVGAINFIISFAILCVLSWTMFYALSLEHKEPTIGVVAMFFITASLLSLLVANHLVAISIVYSSDVLAVSNSLGLKGLVTQFQDLYHYLDGFLKVSICK